MLSDPEAQRFWELFERSPLFVKWPEARAQIATMISRFLPGPENIVFRPGEAPMYLFLVVQGTVTATIQRGRLPWLKQEYGPGDYFGHEALFANEYRARAIASPDAVIYFMSAADLRAAMEHNPDLREALLREKLASRLRGIPLFSELRDWEVSRLAQVVEEREFAAGVELNLTEAPGIWIVDWGQVRVTGRANPYPTEWKDWGLTAGNFFVAPGPELRFGPNCAADTARTRLKTRFLYVPARHADQLVSGIPEVGQLLQGPLEIPNFLKKAQPLQNLTDQQLQHLAQCSSWQFVPKEQNISTQGMVGHALVILEEGAALVTATDDRGRPRPRNFLRKEDWYGATSLLEGKRRDATVRAVRGQDSRLDGARVITLDRRDVQYAFAERSDLWHPGVSLFDQMTRVKEERTQYDWMDEGERLQWSDRPHFLWLLFPELGILSGALLVLLIIAVAPEGWRPELGVASLICVLPLTLLLAAWVLINYLDDYYAVTNFRVTRRDRQILMYEARIEAPLEMVQDVTVNVDFWGRIFGYGDVAISTAAKAKAFVFAHVPDPWGVQKLILMGRVEALAAGRGQRKELLRRELISGLNLVLPIPERSNALGEDVGLQIGRLRAGFIGRFLNALSRGLRATRIGFFVHPQRGTSGEFVWRKHWINLLARTSGPTVFLIALVGLAILELRWRLAGMLGLTPTGWILPWLFLVFFGVAWFAYQYADWYNDQYMVTETQLVDVEKKPLGLSEKRRTTMLDRVQTVDAKQETFWRNVLGYGDVIIRTAAADEGLDFLYVPNPKFVQGVIFRKVEAARFRREQQQAHERQQDIIEALDLYHQVQQSR